MRNFGCLLAKVKEKTKDKAKKGTKVTFYRSLICYISVVTGIVLVGAGRKQRNLAKTSDLARSERRRRKRTRRRRRE